MKGGYIVVRRYLQGFSIFDLMVITILAALGVAVSGIVGYLVRIVTSMLFIPGGAVAGGIYMLFLVLSTALTGKRSAAFLCAIVQALIVVAMPFAGSHGAMTLITYTMPGLSVLVLLTLMRHNGCCRLCCFFAGMVANLTGVALVSGLVMALPMIPMMLGLTLGALSGGLGGLLTWVLADKIKAMGVMK